LAREIPSAGPKVALEQTLTLEEEQEREELLLAKYLALDSFASASTFPPFEPSIL
jgi:hypothetical protein